MNHHRTGRGEPLVLIHGIGHHWQGWRPVIDRLAPSFDVVAPDTPGFGQCAPLPPHVEPNIDAYTDAFIAFFAEQGLGRPHVAGNSMGGAIVLELARRGAVASATAISPVGFWTARERRFSQRSFRLSMAIPKAMRPAVLAAAGNGVGRGALFGQLFARPWRMPADEARLMLKDFWASPGLRPTLSAFEAYTFGGGPELTGVPLTVAWGSRDMLLLYGRQAPRARRVLPQARHVTLPGLGHTPFFDDPDLVASVIADGTKN